MNLVRFQSRTFALQTALVHASHIINFWFCLRQLAIKMSQVLGRYITWDDMAKRTTANYLERGSGISSHRLRCHYLNKERILFNFTHLSHYVSSELLSLSSSFFYVVSCEDIYHPSLTLYLLRIRTLYYIRKKEERTNKKLLEICCKTYAFHSNKVDKELRAAQWEETLLKRARSKVRVALTVVQAFYKHSTHLSIFINCGSREGNHIFSLLQVNENFPQMKHKCSLSPDFIREALPSDGEIQPSRERSWMRALVLASCLKFIWVALISPSKSHQVIV